MLNDEHLKVVYYTPNSTDVFPNVDIKGGVAITYRDAAQNFGAIKMFSHFDELNTIRQKVLDATLFSSISDIIYQQNKFDLDALYNDYPECKNIIGSGGKEKD